MIIIIDAGRWEYPLHPQSRDELANKLRGFVHDHIKNDQIPELRPDEIRIIFDDVDDSESLSPEDIAGQMG